MSLKAVTAETFDVEVTEASNDAPVIVDFWASWCGPCKVAMPQLEAMSTELEGKVVFVKVDVDTNPSLAKSFSIRGIPAFLVFQGGTMVEQINGDVGKLRGTLDAILTENEN